MSQVFVPLHNHSHGSTLDGFSSEEEIAQRCKKIGAKAAAITDHGDCGRHFYFDLACRSAGIKPIFGIEAYVVDDVKKSRERKDSPGSFSHACIWALNNKGLENLWTLSTIAYDEDHFYYKPRMDFELLSKYSEGLAISDGCLLAEVARGIVNDEEDKALDYLTTMIDIFGKENVYIELHTWQFIDPSDERQRALNASMSKANRGKLKLAKKLGLKTIAVNDSHYSEREDHVFHDLIWELATGKGGASSSDTETEDGVSLGRGETAAWIMTDDEVRLYLGRHGIPSSDIEEAILNTVELADRCNAELDMKPKFPFITGDESKDRELFFETVEKGFEKKVPKGKEEEYRRRLDTEVEVILDKHFHGYFNVVSDYMKFAKEPDPLGIKGFPGKEGVLCGAARGSAAASLVCYLMDISEIDPVKHDLPFERFLSMSRGVDPGTRLFLEDGSIIFKKHEDGEVDIKTGDEVDGVKVSAIQEGFVGDFPDIDSDFPSAFGGDIVKYLASRHGKENVCCVGTYQTSQTKSAFKDVAKAFKIPFRVSNSISKHLPSVEEYDFKTQAGRDKMYSGIPELFEHKEIVDKLGPYTAKMAGRVRQSGAHPSGYIISNESLMGKLPMRYKDGELVSQFDLYACSNTGFIKYDILKISALDIVDMAAREAIKSGKVVRKEIDGKMRYFNRDSIENASGYEAVEDFTTDMIYSGATNDLYNPEIWEPTKRGDSLGIFQMETKGGTSMAIQMQVEDVDDAAIMSAVNRPGMTRSGLAWVFFKRRRGEEKVTYPHPMLEGILGDTQGFFVFQEQVMNMFVVLCNYTMEESDQVRKIVTKKNIEQMVPLKKDFIKSCKENKEFVDQVPERFASVEECCEEIWSMMEHSVEYSFNMGHCLAGMSRIRLDTGEVISISEAFKRFESGEKLRITQMKEDGTIGFGDVKQVMFSGVKEMLTLTLSNKKKIRATGDHKFLTTAGYKKLSDIKAGDVLLSDDHNSYAHTVLSEDMKDIQSRITHEDRCKHQQEIQRNNPERTKNWQESSVRRVKELMQDPEWAKFYSERVSEGVQRYWDGVEDKSNDRNWAGFTFWHTWDEDRLERHKEKVSKWVREWRSSLTEEELKELQRSVTEGKRRAGTLNFGRRTIISDGRVCDSLFEASVAEYLLERGVELELHKLVPGTQRFCDFYVNGVYVEADGLSRGKQFFKDRKYGDDVPFLVVTPNDWKYLIDEMLMQHNVKNGLDVISVEKVPLPGRWRKTYGKTFDIEMEDNCPANFIVDGVVSHNSMSYAYLSGWQSWLKVNFLQEFVMASLTHRSSDLRLYKTYAEKSGFKVLPPCVNNSKRGFAVESKDVRSPLSIVSNVGGKAQDEIILNQPFGSVEDFEERTSGRNARRINVYKNLALSGALDEIEPDRKKMLDHVFISKGRVRDTPLGTEADHDIDLSSKAKIAKAEESVMGISFSFDPMSQVEGILKVDAISSEPEIDEVKVGRRFVTYGQVVAIKHHESKSGLMAWVTLQLLDNFQIEVTMFASMFSQVKHLFEVSDVVLLSLKRDNDFAGKRSYIVNELINMTDHLS